MPYKITWEQNGIYREYNGIVSSEDVIKSNAELYNAVKPYSKTRFQIIDFSNIDQFKADHKTVKSAIAMSCGYYLSSQNIKVACIIRRSENILYVADCIKELIKFQPNWSFRVFKDISSARAWVSKS